MDHPKAEAELNPKPAAQNIVQDADPEKAPQASNVEDKIVIESQEPVESTEKVSPEADRKAPLGQKSVRWSSELVTESPNATNTPYAGSNLSVSPSPLETTSATIKDTMETVRNVLGRWGKRAAEATKKAEDLAGNTWQHLKTGPSFTEATLGRIAQGTKVLAEGGYEKIFRHTFETDPEEQLVNSYACYLSTSAGPVMGVLYLSTAKLAFSSDSPLSYKSGNETEWSYYKVVIPLHQLKAVNPSSSRASSGEKYIQVISVDNHEFWYMGFLNYNSAVECLQEALQTHNQESV